MSENVYNSPLPRTILSRARGAQLAARSRVSPARAGPARACAPCSLSAVSAGGLCGAGRTTRALPAHSLVCRSVTSSTSCMHLVPFPGRRARSADGSPRSTLSRRARSACRRCVRRGADKRETCDWTDTASSTAIAPGAGTQAHCAKTPSRCAPKHRWLAR